MDRQPLGRADAIRANSRDLPLADNSVDLVVTSPPYFALRSYQDGGEHYAGQIGDEPTPAEFVDSLVAATREMMRVVKPSGSIWVNLGDKYAGNGGGGKGSSDGHTGRASRPPRHNVGIPTKSLMGIPWRYAIRCIDDLGLILRAEVIWSKPNGLPESVTDRVRRSHEQWFHFTLSPRYFSAVDEIREGYAPGTAERYAKGYNPERESYAAGGPTQNGAARHDGGGPAATNPLGKLPGSVWTVPTEPLHVPEHLGIDHFAAFPMEWPRRIIQGWSPAGVCVECGEGRRPVAGGLACACTPRTNHRGKRGDWREGREANESQRAGESDTVGSLVARRPGGFGTKVPLSPGEWEYHFDGWEPAPTTPGVVLDPFGGTGTTALVAKALGRHGITVDMSADYCRLAEWRTNDPKQLAKAARREFKPSAEPIDGQGDLLDLLGGEPA